MPLILFLFTIRVLQRPPSTRLKDLLHEMGEGLAFLRQDPPALRILLLVGLCSLTSVPYFSFLPMLADTVLRGGPAGSGILMSITGVGALLAALRLTFAGHVGAMGA